MQPVLERQLTFPVALLNEMLANQSTPVPRFVRVSTYRMVKCRYKKWIKQFWAMTCACRHFAVICDKGVGFRLISKTNKLNLVQGSLKSFHVSLCQNLHVRLQEAGYGSLYSSGTDEHYILYGPMQFVNHTCGSLMSLRKITSSSTSTGKKVTVQPGHSFRLVHEHDDAELKSFNLCANAVQPGEEVRVSYVPQGTPLWFACDCPVCAKQRAKAEA